MKPDPDSSGAMRPKLPLWFDQRQRVLQWHFENGYAQLVLPRVLKPAEIDVLEQLFALTCKALRRTAGEIEAAIAQGTEAGTGQTEGLDPKGNGPVRQDASTPSSQPQDTANG